MLKLKGTDKIKNEKVLHRMGNERCLWKNRAYWTNCATNNHSTIDNYCRMLCGTYYIMKITKAFIIKDCCKPISILTTEEERLVIILERNEILIRHLEIPSTFTLPNNC